MVEYIEREAVHRIMVGLQGYVWKSPENGKIHITVDGDDVNFGVDKIPAADVAPVRHGRWISNEFCLDYYCSNCGCSCPCDMYGGPSLSDFCPDCGTKMDGGENHA